MQIKANEDGKNRMVPMVKQRVKHYKVRKKQQTRTQVIKLHQQLQDLYLNLILVSVRLFTTVLI